MAAPTAKVRLLMYQRDWYQCAATGRTDALTHQHRRAVGMGGSKIPPSITDSLTLTASINDRCERDLQTMALAYGWKVRGWVKDPADVPVFYVMKGWARLTEEGDAEEITEAEASKMMREVYGDEWDQWIAEVDNQSQVGRVSKEG